MTKKVFKSLREFTDWMLKAWIDALNRAGKAERDDRNKEKRQ
jgi:hypothetical protein